MYDIIGDIHGHADRLRELLENELHYQADGAGYRHEERQALFVGDFIDRGPQICESLQIVRSMIDSGAAQAVLGNHEFNALAYHTIAPNNQRGYLRLHVEKNNRQHAETLRQLTGDQLCDALDWFRTLPLYLRCDGCHLVHACWSESDINVVDERREHHNGVGARFLAEATDGHSPLFYAVEHLLKGPEMNLPPGRAYLDKDQHRRIAARIQWFRPPDVGDIAEYVFPASSESIGPLAANFSPPVQPYDSDWPPVFFGHYWLRGRPRPQRSNVACVDYSVARGGALVAYRWDGESMLTEERFHSVGDVREPADDDD